MSWLAISISSAITFSTSASCALAAAKSRAPSGPRMSMISAKAAGLRSKQCRKLLSPRPKVYTAWCHSVYRIRTQSYDLRRNGQHRRKHPTNRLKGTLKGPEIDNGNASVRNRTIGRSVDRSGGPRGPNVRATIRIARTTQPRPRVWLNSCGHAASRKGLQALASRHGAGVGVISLLPQRERDWTVNSSA